MDIEDLIDIEFHDLPVESLVFDFQSKRIVMYVSIYNERNSNYDEQIIQFNDVFDVQFKGIFLLKNKYNVNVHWATTELGNDGIYYIEINFVQGTTEAPFDLSFKFKSVGSG